MSRLSETDPGGPTGGLPPATERVLRTRRRGGPIHPQEIDARLREKAAKTSPRIGPTPYGWLVIVYLDDEIGPNGLPKRIVRETSPEATFAEARAILDKELARHGPRNAWIVAKQRPDQKTVRP